MRMYKKTPANITTMKVNKSFEGESIEQKLNRIISNKEPIKDTMPMVYTDRRDGVVPEFDPRRDKFEEMIDARDTVTKNQLAKRNTPDKSQDIKPDEKKDDGKPESTQATPS